MKLVEIQKKYIGGSEVPPIGVSCKIFRGGITALLHSSPISSERKQVLDVQVKTGINVVTFNFERGLDASRLSPVRVGENLVMQLMNGEIAGFDVYRADEYLSSEELAAMERLSQTPSVYRI